MFSVEGTQYFSVEGTVLNMFSVFCWRYSICFLLKVLIMFSVESTQSAFCCRYSVLNLFSFSVVGTQCFLFSDVGIYLFSVFCWTYSICFLLKVLIMFSVERTQYVFCWTYSICFLLKVLNIFLLKVLYSICFLFSVEGTQYVSCWRYSLCFLLKVLNLFSVVGTVYSICFLFLL